MNQDFKSNVQEQFNKAVTSDMQRNKISKTYTWPVIILMLVIFFPVGLYLLFKRFTTDKTNIQKNSKSLRLTGLILIGIGLFYALMGVLGNLETSEGTSVVSGVIIMLLIFGGIGTGFLIASRNLKKNDGKLIKYIDIIIKQKHTEIDNIAANAGVPYEVAKKDIQNLINSGYFPGAYINETSRKIIFQQPIENTSAKTQSAQTKVIACKGCGANNTVVIGHPCECEYCGVAIE